MHIKTYILAALPFAVSAVATEKYYKCDNHDMSDLMGYNLPGAWHYAEQCTRLQREWVDAVWPAPRAVRILAACACIMREATLSPSPTPSSTTKSTSISPSLTPSSTTTMDSGTIIGTERPLGTSISAASLTTSAPSTLSTTTSTISTVASTTTTTKNVLRNGDFADYDARAPNKFSHWTSQGNTKPAHGYGYTGDGTRDKNSVSLSATAQTSAKMRAARNIIGLSSIQQYISNLRTDTAYNLRLFYQVRSNDVADKCILDAYLGSKHLASSPFLPVVDGKEDIRWQELNVVLAKLDPAGWFAVRLNCTLGGSATVLVDSVSVVEARV